MKLKLLPIIGAVLLVIAMAVQFFVSYRAESERVLERIDLKIQLAQKDFVFGVYDIQDAGEEMRNYVLRHINDPYKILQQTRITLHRYEDVLACYVSFRPGFYSKDDYWFCPCSWRMNDSITMEMYGNEEHDYFQTNWYKGALNKDERGYWSPSYRDEDFSSPICTHSVRVNHNGELVCVIGLDFSMDWLDRMLEEIKPFEDAYCLLYSSDGSLILTSDNMGSQTQLGNDMIIRSSMLSPMDMRLEIGVPKRHVLKIVRDKSLVTLAMLLSGILVAGLLIRRIWKNQEAYARVQVEKQLMEREMRIASQIQMGILRKGRRDKVKGDKWPDVLLQAAVVPMREVGGDLYDYYRKDDDLYFIIGDVSGKSVPAAMFMSATVNLFRSAVQRLQSPKAIMEEMNFVLSDNNPSMMFVTALIGRLHIPTGELLYCNAGHLAPIKVPRDKGQSDKGQSDKVEIETLQLIPNIPMGYEGKFRFQEQGTMLGKDEMLVLYTDGITEARNEQREMLGMKRWIDIILSHQKALREGDFETIENAGLQFVGKAEQTDDMTIMTITQIADPQPLTMHVENQIARWPELKTAFQNYALCAGLDKRIVRKIEVAVEELVVNIANYSQADWLEMRVENLQPSAFSIQLRDNGVAFDPTAQAEKDIDKAIEERQIGGLGIALAKQIADELHYRRIDDTNELTIIKNI